MRLLSKRNFLTAIPPLLGGITYIWFMNNPFLMDDEIQILMNTHIHSLNNVASFFKSSTMFSGGKEQMFGVYFKPFLTMYYSVMWSFFGANAFAFRLPLLIAHLFSGVLLGEILRRRLRGLNHANLIAACAATTFILHPVNSEVVLYIADAQDTFYMLFGLAAVAVIEFTRKSKWLIFALPLLLVSSVLFKETGAIFVPLAIMYAWIYRREWFKSVCVLGAAVTAGYVMLRFDSGLISTRNEELIFHHADFWTRLKMLPLILTHYLEVLLLPWRLSLTTDFVVDGYPLNQFWFPLGVLVVFLGWLGWSTWKRSWWKTPGSQLFTLTFLLWFGLHGQQFIALDGVYADRWAYPLTLLFSVGIGLWAFGSPSLRKWRVVLVGMGSALYMARDLHRGMLWAKPQDLYLWEVRIHPRHALMNSNVGHELMKQGKAAEALPWFEKSMVANPYWSVSVINAGAAYEALGDQVKAEAYYRKAIQMAGYPFAYENLVKLLYHQRRHDELRVFLREQALPRYPKNEILLKVDDYYRRLDNMRPKK